ncbi:MAG TPA: hypothetical protein VKA59_19905 [Vicinamibacterales bacterium]|nr:hypothetical protein [Vicinamibacterales bacterium]
MLATTVRVIALLVWRATWVTLFAYRRGRRRQALGRWLTIALATLAIYLAVPAVTPTVRVRIQEAVGGTMREGDAEVALLGYGADCESTPYERQTLERAFPIGTRVVVFGAARVRDAGTAVVVAEENRSHYVVRIPQSVPRTSYGDIDFQRANGNGPFLDFEFDRIVLTLLKNPVKDRVPRLKNLAYYFADPYLYMPTAPEVSR